MPGKKIREVGQLREELIGGVSDVQWSRLWKDPECKTPWCAIAAGMRVLLDESRIDREELADRLGKMLDFIADDLENRH